MPLLGASAWAGGLGALLLPADGRTGWLVAAATFAVIAVLVTGVRARATGTAVACLLVAGGVAAGGLLRAEAVSSSAVARLAQERAVVRAELTVTSDPVVRRGRFSEFTTYQARVELVEGRGRTHRVRVPVLVLADVPDALGAVGDGVPDVQLGSRLAVLARLAPADDSDLAAVLTVRGEPAVRAAAGPSWRAAAAVRASIRAAARDGPGGGAVLVPALVAGDDTGLSAQTTADFEATGLTHLLAVSGTNLTIVLGFLLWAARWCGVRGRWQLLVGGFGIVAFVLIARTEPSVVRAAAMGTVGLLGLGANGRQRGTRALGLAVVVLLLLDPWLAVSVGFVLSVLATAGILFLAPGWRDALATWLPRPLAEAVAVPAAAQVVCTPVVAAISGQVSLVAVAANLLVAPAVGPATVLGLLGGVAGLLAPPAGALVGWLAAASGSWIVEVAERGARLPTAAVGWGTGPVALGLLSVACLVLALGMPSLLRRPTLCVGCTALLVFSVLVPAPTPGWPPPGWVLVACAVGQGDALVLNAGDGRAVVVDAGPDSLVVDRCLDRLGIEEVPLVALTHFHADHVDGLSGVLSGRPVGRVLVTGRADPAEGADDVLALTRGRVPVEVPAYAQTRVVDDVTLQVLGPLPGLGADAGESAANNASLVLLVEVGGIRVLLTGDVEPGAQRALSRAWPGLRADVLKVPHHGSRHQHQPWLTGLGARLAVVSVGADNDYGHPSASVLAALAAAGTEVARTDLRGDVAVSVRDGEVYVAAREP